MSQLKVIKRNGETVLFDQEKIASAVMKAAASVGLSTSQCETTSRHVSETVSEMYDGYYEVTVEEIQDAVEEVLMNMAPRIARAYIIYRENRTKNRVSAAVEAFEQSGSLFSQIVNDVLFIAPVSVVSVDRSLVLSIAANVFMVNSSASTIEMIDSLVIQLRTHIQNEPEYTYVCADLINAKIVVENIKTIMIYHQTPNNDLPVDVYKSLPGGGYKSLFLASLSYGISKGRLDQHVVQAYTHDIITIAEAVDSASSVSLGLTLLGIQTLYDRYLLHDNEQRFESVPGMFMRIAMGLAHREPIAKRVETAIEFFNVLIGLEFMSSTPTLFNAGTLRPQLSSCYLTTIPDDLAGIYDAIKEDALLSKYAGGIGNDWTPVRGLGSHIKGTNGKSQGVVPFMKVANDTAVAVNQGGKRRGAICGYLETWHIDIEDFLELRKNTGDERRRTHDMNTANWIPDLFMERVLNDEDWTLFSPDDVSDLHDSVGNTFKVRYEEYEALAKSGSIKLFKTIKAKTLWRKMLTMLFETGHPWITFKDAFNIRYSNQHVGVIHSSNLCTEIGLHTNDSEIAVCNLGSVNVTKLIDKNTGRLSHTSIKKVVYTAVRMLDNVIDYNYYSVEKAANSNHKHRPIGLGIMGFQDLLYMLNIPYDSVYATDLASDLQEAISYYAISASMELARERGKYESFSGSLWSKGILPMDSYNILAETRHGSMVTIARQSISNKMWDDLRTDVMKYGMRNSNVMAIAPTATISNICGVSQSTEPTYQNIFVKSNLSGEFTVVNEHLVRELKAAGLWTPNMITDIIVNDGSVQSLNVPDYIKRLFKTAFEIDPMFLIYTGAARQKWIDQAASLNLYMADATGRKLDSLYMTAWMYGLKSTYYLRTLGATGNEKTVDAGVISNLPATDAVFCSIDNQSCEACS